MRAKSLDLTAHEVIHGIAGRPADLYVSESLFPALARILRPTSVSLEGIRQSLSSDNAAFATILSYYATARRGHERETLSRMMLLALSRTLGESSFAEFLDSGDSEALWISFTEVCGDAGRKPAEQQNRPVIEGLAELAFEIYEEIGHGNIVKWICDEISETHRCEEVFNRLVEVKTLGPKAASHILRDVTYIFDLEDTLDYSDRLFLQPINSAVRRVANYVLDMPEDAHYADWVLAGKLSRAIRLAKASGVRFNFGCTYIGTRLARQMGGVDSVLREMVAKS